MIAEIMLANLANMMYNVVSLIEIGVCND